MANSILNLGKRKHKPEGDDFVTLDRIDETNAIYRLLIGKRSNGKSFAVLSKILKNYVENNKRGAYIRREEEDIRGSKGANIFAAIVNANLVRKYTHSKWEYVVYKNRAFYLAKYDEDLEKEVCDENPFCYAFSITGAEHYKSVSFPDINIVLFDEFLSVHGYITNEFVEFMNLLSTIRRQRDDFTIYMCANTVQTDSIYFKEMGLGKVKTMSPGDMYLYTYKDERLTVALLFTDEKGSVKDTDYFTAFDNPELQMISDGSWAIPLYPHCPISVKPKDIRYKYFIIYSGETFECDIVYNENIKFTFIHPKTTELKEDYENNCLIYSDLYDPRINWSRNILKPRNKREQMILNHFLIDKVYFSDNTTGDAISNYFNYCKINKGIA